MISANTLFHFTNSLDNIKNILSNHFSPRYCLESVDFISPDEKMEFAFPMICFCDIPLSQISEHVNSYGDYAIGLKKEWAIDNGISPVLYLYKDSRTNKMLNRLFASSARIDRIKQFLKKDTSNPATLEFLEFLFYCKIYKGSMWRDGKLRQNITFYNEREWRYVPKLDELEHINPKLICSKKEYKDIEIRKNFNNNLAPFQVRFEPKDIKYIIIRKETERLEMISMIEQIKGGEFLLNDIKELNSKILSIEQIKDDF